MQTNIYGTKCLYYSWYSKSCSHCIHWTAVCFYWKLLALKDCSAALLLLWVLLCGIYNPCLLWWFIVNACPSLSVCLSLRLPPLPTGRPCQNQAIVSTAHPLCTWPMIWLLLACVFVVGARACTWFDSSTAHDIHFYVLLKYTCFCSLVIFVEEKAGGALVSTVLYSLLIPWVKYDPCDPWEAQCSPPVVLPGRSSTRPTPTSRKRGRLSMTWNPKWMAIVRNLLLLCEQLLFTFNTFPISILLLLVFSSKHPYV